ncbi:UNKNOWN [Stylonychia lemnae]|uniref:Protein yippee-like n=1 Tax=Stylonychia lemnae TaxID=5949 RepID=A0A078BBF4_STYLE|nr:UNKNOWN [Stylonychia lemnae]|eukprot:CDW91541.1 UNKNOWN [Stylonychia lemnae]
MGFLHLEYSEGVDAVYVCKNCNTHLTTPYDIVSRTFHGKTGKAYLFSNVMNVQTGPAEDKHLSTGLHQVRDIYCKQCLQVVGWTYDLAYVESEKYKEGKSVIEKFYIKKKYVNTYTTTKDEKNLQSQHNTSQMSISTAGISARSTILRSTT